MRVHAKGCGFMEHSMQSCEYDGVGYYIQRGMPPPHSCSPGDLEDTIPSSGKIITIHQPLRSRHYTTTVKTSAH